MESDRSYAEGRKHYRIFEGRPSWHQARAGLTCAATMSCYYTPDELKEAIANMKKHGEPFYITEWPEPTDTKQHER